MSLAGAGRSPQSSPRQRSAPSGAIYSPISKSQTCADSESRGIAPCGCRAEPAIFTASAVSAVRRNLFPHKQVADLRRLGVKGHCPLRVQGGARNPLSRSDQRHKAHSIPTISKTKFCASLPSGNPRRQAYPFPNKQTAGLRPTAPAVKRGFAANHSRNKQVTDLPSHSPQSKT